MKRAIFALLAAALAGPAAANPADGVMGVIGTAGELGAGALILPAAPEEEPASVPAGACQDDSVDVFGRPDYTGRVDLSRCEFYQGCEVRIHLSGRGAAQWAPLYRGHLTGQDSEEYYVNLDTVMCEVSRRGRYACWAYPPGADWLGWSARTEAPAGEDESYVRGEGGVRYRRRGSRVQDTRPGYEIRGNGYDTGGGVVQFQDGRRCRIVGGVMSDCDD